MKLLLLDTATENCSVALYLDGVLLERQRELARGHGDELLPMIDALLAEAQLKLTALDAIAFGRGPGGFTGVRLAVSATQGLAFASGLRVLPVSNLQSVAQLALEADASADGVLVCNDARMGEVYCAEYRRDAAGVAQLLGAESVLGPAQVPELLGPGRIVGAGRGFRAYPLLTERFAPPVLASIDAELLPSARGLLPQALADWSAGRSLPAAQAQPVYLRDNVAHPARAATVTIP